MTSYQYRKAHCGDKTILWPSYLHNGISYTGKITSLYWIGPWINIGSGNGCLRAPGHYLNQCWLHYHQQVLWHSRLILCLPPANERRRYKVMPSLIGWAQTLAFMWHFPGNTHDMNLQLKSHFQNYCRISQGANGLILHQHRITFSIIK